MISKKESPELTVAGTVDFTRVFCGGVRISGGEGKRGGEECDRADIRA
jgi:hypothetical protein